ncbi:MAG TPA: SPOR domain-containing protein [Williamwhitmania sp.]|nr:SPOR domain-containing protein [Williamwhitmania sp.]
MKSNLGELIAELLRRNNRVSLPGLGAFVAKYKPAIIDEATLVITPPTKEISFSKEETWNDKLLENLVAEQEGLTPETAAIAVGELVEQIKETLDNENKYIIEGLGILVKDGGDFSFKIEEGLNLLPDAYGLESIVLQKNSSEKETASEKPKEISPKPNLVPPARIVTRKGGSSVIWVAAISLIAIACMVLWLFTDIFTPQQVPTSPMVSQAQPAIDSTAQDSIAADTSEKANVEEVINTQTEKKKALYYEEPKSSANAEKVFYIIAGSFTKERNAERLKSSLEKKGFKPEILTVDGPVYRVSMFSFTNRNRALEELARLRDENKQMNIWLLGL